MAQTSKKELKEMRKLEEARQKSMEKKAGMTKWITIGAISTIFLGFFIFLVVSLRSSNPSLNPNSASQVELSSSGEYRIASDSTTPIEERVVTLTEFADFQCPACKQYHPIVKSVLDLYPEQVVLNYKHFPINSIHPNATPAALAAEAAGEQNKFFEMADILYERQEAWAGLPNPEEVFLSYAEELEMDLEKFKQDLGSSELAKKIESQRTEGINAGVNSTPSFFVNGIRIENPSDISGFQAAIDAELEKSGAIELPVEEITSTPSAENAPQINL